MNKVLLSLVFSGFILTGTCFAQAPAPAEAPAAAAAPAAAPEAPKPVVHREHKAEHHPELRKAMRKLRGAKQDLEKATHDFDGHKAKAIEAIDTAIEEIKAAMDYDKK